MADPLKDYVYVDTVYIDLYEVASFNRYLMSFIGSIHHGKRIKDIKVDTTRDSTDTIKVDIYAKFYEQEEQMTIEEQLKKEIKDAQEALERAQKKLEELEKSKKQGWWKPEYEHCYYYINDDGCVCQDSNDDVEIDHMRIEDLNCFKTEEEAELEQLQIVIRRRMQEIALRLNKGRKIDWDNNAETKYFARLMFPSVGKYVIVTREAPEEMPLFDRVYCLDREFAVVIYGELKSDIEKYCNLQKQIANKQ